MRCVTKIFVLSNSTGTRGYSLYKNRILRRKSKILLSWSCSIFRPSPESNA